MIQKQVHTESYMLMFTDVLFVIEKIESNQVVLQYMMDEQNLEIS